MEFDPDCTEILSVYDVIVGDYICDDGCTVSKIRYESDDNGSWVTIEANWANGDTERYFTNDATVWVDASYEREMQDA